MHEHQQIEIKSALGPSKLTLRRSGDDVIGVRISTPDYNVSTVINIPDFLAAARVLCEGPSAIAERPMDRVFKKIAEERARQNAMVDAKEIPLNCSSPLIPLTEKSQIWTEEVLEASREFVAHTNAGLAVDRYDAKQRLRKELIQVAAVTVSILESMEGQP